MFEGKSRSHGGSVSHLVIGYEVLVNWLNPRPN
jgi:hypothetical protein